MRSPAQTSPKTGVGLQELLEQFLAHIVGYRGCAESTAEAYARDCSRLITFRDSQRLSLDATDVTTPEVRLFLASLRHLSANSLRRTLYGLSSFFSYLENMEIVPGNPVAAIEPPKRQRALPKMPTPHQCQWILDGCETLLEEAIIGLLLHAGLRRGEVLGLSVADVAADFSQLRVDGKGGRERVVPISSHLREILNSYLAERDSDDAALIVGAQGGRMGVTQFYRVFRRILKRADLDHSGITPHHLRHAFATALVRAGVDVATIGALLGHAGLGSTTVYLHATAGSKREAVERLPFAHGSSLGAGHMDDE